MSITAEQLEDLALRVIRHGAGCGPGHVRQELLRMAEEIRAMAAQPVVDEMQYEPVDWNVCAGCAGTGVRYYTPEGNVMCTDCNGAGSCPDQYRRFK